MAFDREKIKQDTTATPPRRLASEDKDFTSILHCQNRIHLYEELSESLELSKRVTAGEQKTGPGVQRLVWQPLKLGPPNVVMMPLESLLVLGAEVSQDHKSRRDGGEMK